MFIEIEKQQNNRGESHMSIPTYEEIMLPLLRILSDGGTCNYKEFEDKKIILIGGYKLAEYMIDFNVGITIQEVYEVKRIDNDYFEE